MLPDPLTGKLLTAAASAAGKQVVEFIKPLVGLMDAQQKILKEIQRDTKALVEAPLKEARIYVENAAIGKDEEYQRTLLLKAEEAFVRAASQLTDPLNESYAWTGSALIKAYFRPNEKDIIQDHFHRAYTSAVTAGEKAADPAPKEGPAWLARPSRAALWVTKGLFTPSFISSELAFGRRPRSFRVSSGASLKMPGLGRFHAETYSASRPARRRENQLLEISSHIWALREILIGYGKAASEVPPYRVRLEPGPHISYGTGKWFREEVTYWVLHFESEETDDDVVAGAANTVMLSDDRKRVTLALQRRTRAVNTA